MVMLQGALSTFAPWTPDEDARLLDAYLRAGTTGAELALPHRSRAAIWHRVQRKKVRRRARRSQKDFADLREFWAEGLPLHTIAKRLGRPPRSVYWHAYRLGLTSDVPQGFTRLTDAAQGAGYATSQLRRILRWAHKRLHAVTSRPGPRKTRYRFWMVTWEDLHDAIDAWHKTESVQAAARRLGISADALRRRLAKLGLRAKEKQHLRVTEEQIEAANRMAKWNRRSGRARRPTGMDGRAA